MRIAYLTSVYARQSDTFIRNEVLELRARGHHVETFSIRRERGAGPLSAEIAAEQATTCYILATPKATLATTVLRTMVASPLATLRAFATAMRLSPPGLRKRAMHVAYWVEAAFLAARLRAAAIEILHNHIAGNSATVALLASEMSGVPFSMTVHGPGIFFEPHEWALPEKIRRAAFTACISSFCRSQCMLFSRLADWPRLKVVRCGVGRAFENARPVPPPERPRLVFVGRLCAEKGLPVLVEAVTRFVRRGGVCEVVVIGDGPLRAEVERFVAAEGLSQSIRLLGWRGSDEIVDELTASRALVLPSFAEGLPVVVMEALALARPVITTAIAGIPELVIDGENGWLVPAGSVDALVDAIAEAVTAPVDRLWSMGQRGRASVCEQHALGREVARLEAHLQAAVRAGAHPARLPATPDDIAFTADP